MAYRVTHTTAYQYAEPVSICHNEARLTPRSTPRQRLVRSQLLVDPGVQTMDQDRDYFGNVVHYFSLTEAHRHLSVTAVSEVELESGGALDLSASEPWEELRDSLREAHEGELLAARELTFDSPHVKQDAELLAFALPSFEPKRPLCEAALDLTRRIHREFQYQPGATTVATPLKEVLRTRRGVCQDFAHLEIAMLRALGLPARYISGYVYTRAGDDSAPRGGDASHAWVGVFSARLGWVDFDPTNGSVPSSEHVTLGWGRDFSDASPLKGVILGGGEHAVRVSVDMARV
jgi:transglutaminase-like putative cysteine protease